MSEQLEQAIRACLPIDGDYSDGDGWLHETGHEGIASIVASFVTLIHEREKQWVQEVGRARIDAHFAMLPEKERLADRIKSLESSLVYERYKNGVLSRRRATDKQQKRELKKQFEEKDKQISELDKQLDARLQRLPDEGIESEGHMSVGTFRILRLADDYGPNRWEYLELPRDLQGETWMDQAGYNWETWSQCIGRLDHHDRAMYVGDIIEYIDNTSQGLVKKIVVIQDIRRLPDFSCSKREEIIGNRWEHPELSKEAT